MSLLMILVADLISKKVEFRIKKRKRKERTGCLHC